MADNWIIFLIKVFWIVYQFFQAYSIHKSVLNLPYDLPFENEDTKEDLQQLEYGNKIAILGKICLCLENKEN